MEAAPDKRISKLIFMQPHLRTLLIGKVEEVGEDEVSHNYNSLNNVDQLQIYNLFHKWMNEDVWIFASSLYLPYISTV